jgi:hypothetical protein
LDRDEWLPRWPYRCSVEVACTYRGLLESIVMVTVIGCIVFRLTERLSGTAASGVISALCDQVVLTLRDGLIDILQSARSLQHSSPYTMDVARLVRTHVTSSDLDPSGELVDGVLLVLLCLLTHLRHQRRQRAAARRRQGARRVPHLYRGRRAAEGCVCWSRGGELANAHSGLTFLSNLIKKVNPAKINRPAGASLRP